MIPHREPPVPGVSPLRVEVRRLLHLALPAIGTQVGWMLMGVVDTVMVGRVGVEALGAASLGHAWVIGTLIIAMGVIMGIDPIVTQAHGAGDGRRLGAALQRGIVLSLPVSAPVALLWLQTGPVLEAFGQDPALAREAHRYAVAQIPSIPAFLVFTALRQYLQGRGIVRPILWVVLLANGANALLNWVLIFGRLGAPRLGVLGAGLATGLTRVFLLAGLLVLVRAFSLHRGAWVPWSRAALRGRELAAILRLGLPIGLQFGLEVWAFQIATFLAGRLGAQELAASTIVLNLASLSFMVPLGISIGAVTRVGNLIGAGDPRGAQRAAWVALALGAGVMALWAAVFVAFRGLLPRLYTPDAAVAALAAGTLPVAAAFQVFDGTQVVGGGILRGMGRTLPAAAFNFMGYYLLATPLALVLAFPLGLGLPGIWWGLCLGLAVIACLLVGWIWRKGPAGVAGSDPL